MLKRNQAGFTLAEFALVMGLAAFATIASLPAMLEKSHERAAQQTEKGIRMLANAAIKYRTDERFIDATTGGTYQFGTWPGAVSDLQGSGCGSTLTVGCFDYLGHFPNRNGFGNAFAFGQSGEALSISTTAPAPYGMRVISNFGPNTEITTNAGVDSITIYIPPPGQEALYRPYAMLDGSRAYRGDISFGTAMTVDTAGDIVSTGGLHVSNLIVTNDMVHNDGSTPLRIDIGGDLDVREMRIDEIDALAFCYPGSNC